MISLSKTGKNQPKFYGYYSITHYQATILRISILYLHFFYFCVILSINPFEALLFYFLHRIGNFRCYAPLKGELKAYNYANKKNNIHNHFQDLIAFFLLLYEVFLL